MRFRSRKQKLANPENYASLGPADETFRAILDWPFTDERLEVNTARQGLEFRYNKALIWIEDGEVRMADVLPREDDEAGC